LLFIPHFDIAALFIEALIIVFAIRRRNLPILQNRVYIALVCLLTVVTILDFTTELIGIHNPEQWPKAILWILNGMYLCGMPGIAVLYIIYCLSLVDFWNKVSESARKFTLTAIVVPYLLLVLFICLSPIVDSRIAIFRIDEFNIYERGEVSFVFLYALSGIYLFATLLILAIYNKEISKSRIIMMISFVIATIVPLGLQFLFQGLLTGCFGISLGCLAFIVFVQRPEEYLDGTLNIFNLNGLNVMEQENFRNNSEHTCIGLIIDDTVFLNNTFGFKKFNEIMVEVGEFLKTSFKVSNVFCITQSTFCIVLKRADEKEVRKALDLIKKRFARTWGDDTIKQRLFLRMCVIECPENAKSPEDVVDIINAVTNDPRYKKPIIYGKEVKLEDKKTMTKIEHCVRNGLAENLFEVYYQPIYSTKEKHLIGAEALLRLKDENGQFLNPEIFVPIAERNGTILRIGEFVFETVCKTLSNIDYKRIGIKKIDVNLSVAQCMQESLSDLIQTIQTIYHVPTEVLNLEITESASAHTPEILLKNMNELDAAGFELSLDDYGSGYSNMSYLLNLPFKMIKIDKFIVWAAFKDEMANIALRKTIEMCKALGKTVLAEGVENEEHVKVLTEMGCDYLQGYYFAKGVPLNEFLEIIAKDNNVDVNDSDEIGELEEIDEIED